MASHLPAGHGRPRTRCGGGLRSASILLFSDRSVGEWIECGRGCGRPGYRHLRHHGVVGQASVIADLCGCQSEPALTDTMEKENPRESGGFLFSVISCLLSVARPHDDRTTARILAILILGWESGPGQVNLNPGYVGWSCDLVELGPVRFHAVYPDRRLAPPEQYSIADPGRCSDRRSWNGAQELAHQTRISLRDVIPVEELAEVIVGAPLIEFLHLRVFTFDHHWIDIRCNGLERDIHRRRLAGAAQRETLAGDPIAHSSNGDLQVAGCNAFEFEVAVGSGAGGLLEMPTTGETQLRAGDGRVRFVVDDPAHTIGSGRLCGCGQGAGSNEVESSQSTSEKIMPGQHWNSFAYVYVSTFSLVPAVVKHGSVNNWSREARVTAAGLRIAPEVAITSFQAIAYGRYRSSADPRSR